MEASNYINLNPMGIENDSMAIISAELSHLNIPAQYDAIIKRIIHTTADFEYAHLFESSDNALNKGINALKNGCKIS